MMFMVSRIECLTPCTDLVATALPTLMPSLILDIQLMMQRTKPLGMVTTGLGPGQLSQTTPRGVRGKPWEKVAMLRPWKDIQPVSDRQWTAVGWLSPLAFRYLATSSRAWWTWSVCRKMNLVGRMYCRVSQPSPWYTWLYLLRF